MLNCASVCTYICIIHLAGFFLCRLRLPLLFWAPNTNSSWENAWLRIHIALLQSQISCIWECQTTLWRVQQDCVECAVLEEVKNTATRKGDRGKMRLKEGKMKRSVECKCATKCKNSLGLVFTWLFPVLYFSSSSSPSSSPLFFSLNPQAKP